MEKKIHYYRKSHCNYFDIKAIFRGDYEVQQNKPEVFPNKTWGLQSLFYRVFQTKPEVLIYLLQGFPNKTWSLQSLFYRVLNSLHEVYTSCIWWRIMKDPGSGSSSPKKKVFRYISNGGLCFQGHDTLVYERLEFVFTGIAIPCFRTYVRGFPDVCTRWFDK